jgi:hypothetical protein
MPEEMKTEVGVLQLSFANRFQAYGIYQTTEADVVGRERDLVQLFSLAFVKILFLLGENKQAPMLLQYVQAAMGDTVTPKGLFRPTILGQGQILLETLPEKTETTAVIKLVQTEEARMVELVLPLGEEGHFYPATAIFFLQYLIRTLGDSSLFFLMLVLGGVMEYLEKIGKTNDIQALSAAPVYGFSTAMRYIEGERKRHEALLRPSEHASDN